MSQIIWTAPMRDRFRKAYNAAVEAREESFVFEDNTFVVAYAKYVLEYLDERLPQSGA